MKLVVLGANGFLGRSIFNFLENYKKISFVIIYAGKEIDITNYKQVKNFFKKNRPDYCINAAGISNPDKCEKYPEIAYNVNTLALLNIVQNCQKYSTKLIHFSTDYVFSGNDHHIYRECDEIHPLQIYGKTKGLSEKIAWDSSIIIRLSYLYGFIPCKPLAGFIYPVFKSLINGQELFICNKQVRYFTYLEDVSKMIFNVISKNIPLGIYQFSNPYGYTKYDIANLIKEKLIKFGFKNIGFIYPKNDLKTDVIRPHKCELSNAKIQKYLDIFYTSVDEGVELTLSQIMSWN